MNDILKTLESSNESLYHHVHMCNAREVHVRKIDEIYIDAEKLTMPISNPNFIHDYVCSVFPGKTDTSLGSLTPDFIFKDWIIEVATTVFSNEQEMTSALDYKIRKYKELSETHGKKLCVIIVSYNKSLSNFNVPKSVLNEMIQNYQTAKKLNLEIKEKLEIDLWKNSADAVNKKTIHGLISSSPSLQVSEFDDLFEHIDSNWKSFNYEKSTEEIFEEIMLEMTDMLSTHSYVEKPYTYIPETKGRRDMKRISPLPFAIPVSKKIEDECVFPKLNEEELPSNYRIIIDSSKVLLQKDYFTSKGVSLNELLAKASEPIEEKKKIKDHQFKVNLSQDDLILNGLNGIEAKSLKSNSEIIAKRVKSKEFFSWDSPVNDIEDFIQKVKGLVSNVRFDCSVGRYPNLDLILESFYSVENNAPDFKTEPFKEWKNFLESDLGQYLDFIGDLFCEINNSLRENTHAGFYIMKPLKKWKCNLYLKTTNSSSHVFFFLTMEYREIISETLGSKHVYKDERNLCTEWSSVLKRDIENFLAPLETCFSVFAYLKQLFNQENFDNSKLKKALYDYFSISLLIYFNNKDRNEEIITNLRYVYMKSLSITEKSTQMMKKYTTLYRDRLMIYLTSKVNALCTKLDQDPPKIKSANGLIEIEGLVDPFGNTIDFKQAINFTYLGYVMTKVKQMQSNQSFMMIEKILTYEEKFNKLSMEELKGIIVSNKEHCYDPKWVRTFSEMSLLNLQQRYGKTIKSQISDKILSRLSKSNFEDLATLKASAKLDLCDDISSESMEKLKERRPRVMASLVNIISDYKSDDDAKIDLSSPVDLVNYCLKKIVEEDKFNVELFPKDQHNGLREIYVVDFRVRIVQWFVESISRSICEFFPSETLNNIHTNDSFTPRLIKNGMSELESPLMLAKSGDASKWSQSQLVSKFYIVLKTFLPNEYHNMISNILKLWFKKKIFLPTQLIQSFLSPNFETKNELLREMLEGNVKSYTPGKMYLKVHSGFMQGILHHTSSLFHTVVQEGFKQIKAKLLLNQYKNSHLESLSNKSVLWNMQGSDDSCELMIIDTKLYKTNPSFFNSMMHLKDKLSHKFGIIPSKEKTATCIPYIMEYNSNWAVSGINIQPTVKFPMVACQIPSAQSLLQRQEFFYNLLKDCVEKGCTTYTASLIKISQQNLHYRILGAGIDHSFEIFKKLILNCKNPSLGYFVNEPIVSTGIFGFDFSLYVLYKNQGMISYLQEMDLNSPSELKLTVGNNMKSNIIISKFQWSNWHALEKVVGHLLEHEKKFSEENPVIYYEKTHDWNVEHIKLKQKILDFDVKQSLCSKYGISENMSSFFCMFKRACLLGDEKKSLIEWINDSSDKLIKLDEDLNENVIKMLFPKASQYEVIRDYIQSLDDHYYLADVDYIRRGKSRVKVLGKVDDLTEDFLGIVKYKWFKEDRSYYQNEYMNRVFEGLKEFLPWLKDTEAETREVLKCSSRQLANYIMSSLSKERYLTFFDTTAKDSGWKYMLSRIFKEGKKFMRFDGRHFEHNITNDQVLSSLKFLCTFPYSNQFRKRHLEPLIDKLSTNLLPNHKAKKFKLLKSYLNAQKNKETIDGDISDDFKDLLLSYTNEEPLMYFSTPQFWNKQSKAWEGHGSLNFIYKQFFAKIFIQDAEIQLIIVNDLESLRTNHELILRSLRTIKCQLPSNVSHDLRMTKKTIQMQENGVKIEIDESLFIDIKKLRQIKLIFERGNFKLVALNDWTIDTGFTGMLTHERFLKVPYERRAKNLEEMRRFDRKTVTEEIWLPEMRVTPYQRLHATDEKHEIAGKAAKFVTVLNFEIWKEVLDPYNGILFELGWVQEHVAKGITFDHDKLLTQFFSKLPNSLPVDQIGKRFLQEIEASRSFNDLMAQSMLTSLDFNVSTDEKKAQVLVQDISSEEISEFMSRLFTRSKKFNLTPSNVVEETLAVMALEDMENDYSFFKTLNFQPDEYKIDTPFNIISAVRSNLMEIFNSDLRMVENFITRGEGSSKVPLILRLFCACMLDTPMHCNSKTVRMLKQEILKSDVTSDSIEKLSRKSSSSLSSIGDHGIIDTSDFKDWEKHLLSHFGLNPRKEDIIEKVNEKIDSFQDAIGQLTDMIPASKNETLKRGFMNQIADFQRNMSQLRTMLLRLEPQTIEHQSPKFKNVSTESDNEEEFHDATDSDPSESAFSGVSSGKVGSKTSSVRSGQTKEYTIETISSKKEDDDISDILEEDTSDEDNDGDGYSLFDSIMIGRITRISSIEIFLTYFNVHSVESFKVLSGKLRLLSETTNSNTLLMQKVLYEVGDQLNRTISLVYSDKNEILDGRDLDPDAILIKLINEELHWYHFATDVIIQNPKALLVYKAIHSREIQIPPTPINSCLFNCLSYIIQKELGLEFTNQMLRSVCSLSKEYDIVGDEDSLAQKANIVKDEVMGTEFEIAIIARHFNLKIPVVTDYTIRVYNEDDGRQISRLIINRMNVHFNVLEPLV
uniref:RNA-directed RNA polymerase L n=1 Tax=Raspberry rubodvirus 1 TaxID=3231632 RepID=A0AAU8JNX8_9VIRU